MRRGGYPGTGSSVSKGVARSLRSRQNSDKGLKSQPINCSKAVSGGDWEEAPPSERYATALVWSAAFNALCSIYQRRLTVTGVDYLNRLRAVDVRPSWPRRGRTRESETTRVKKLFASTPIARDLICRLLYV